MRRSLGRAFLLGIVVGVIVALVRRATRAPSPPPPTLERPRPAQDQPRPAAVPEAPAPAPETPPAWAAPVEGGCPEGYPVKAKETSGIFHVPGGLSYERTHPDRCYATPEAATADGFRPAKR